MTKKTSGWLRRAKHGSRSSGFRYYLPESGSCAQVYLGFDLRRLCVRTMELQVVNNACAYMGRGYLILGSL